MSETPTPKQTTAQKPATERNTVSEIEQDTTSGADQLSNNDQNPASETEQNSPSDTASISEQSPAPDTEIVTDQPSIPRESGKKPNALVHGLYAKDIILPWESEQDFEYMWCELVEEWSPEGRSEKETLLGIAHLTWKRHRLMRATQRCFNKSPILSELQKKGYKTWTEVWDFLQSKSEEQADLRVTVKASLNQLTNAQATPEIEELHRLIKLLNAYLTYERRSGDDPSLLIEQEYQPDFLEKVVRIESSIDTRIDKLFGRLINLKLEKKAMRRSQPPQIAAPTITPPNPE